MTGSSQNDDDDGTVGQTLARHYLATTRNWSICGSLSWLLGSHTLVSSFSWIRLSDSPEKQVITVIYLCFICSASWGTDFIWPTLFFREVCLIVKFSGSAHLRLACQGSPPGIWSPHGSHPDLPGVSSGQGQTPASRKNSPVGDDHPNITPGSQNYFNPVSFIFMLQNNWLWQQREWLVVTYLLFQVTSQNVCFVEEGDITFPSEETKSGPNS